MVSYIQITGYSILLFMNPLNFIGHFVAVILKVLLVNLLAALNFENKKTLKNVKSLTEINKRKKMFFTSMARIVFGRIMRRSVYLL